MPPFHVPIAVLITSDIGSFGISRGGVRSHASPPSGFAAHTWYSPNEAASIDQTKAPS